MRPRMWSGVALWLIVDRHTALTESAAPARASSAAAGHSDRINPAIAMATPQHATAQMTISPRRRACLTQPESSAATVAPEGERRRQPRAPRGWAGGGGQACGDGDGADLIEEQQRAAVEAVGDRASEQGHADRPANP
jgi:hypothetical protein